MVLNASHVLREDPELAEALSEPRRVRAVEQCVARTVRIARGHWNIHGEPEMEGGIGYLVLEGLLLRRVGIEGRFGAELLGEGDLLRPWQSDDGAATLTRTTGWRVLEPTRMAVLDADAERHFAAFPELIGSLVGRALERSRNLSINMAIVHQARVHVRLHMLLWHLADRWGRVGVEGVILPLGLTHSVLADLVAARRPTVTSALTELTRHGRIRPCSDGWVLSGDPPGELLELQQVAVSAEPANGHQLGQQEARQTPGPGASVPTASDPEAPDPQPAGPQPAGPQPTGPQAPSRST